MVSLDYVFLGYHNTAGAGGVYPDPDAPPPGNCVSDDTPILLADGTTVPAADLVPGTILRTRHETTMAWGERSEEHTSELQSLMRISYAVFCLKKKIQNTPDKNVTTIDMHKNKTQ